MYFKSFFLSVGILVSVQNVFAAPFPLIETSEELAQVCQKMQPKPYIAVDLEFEGRNLCLIQVCWGEDSEDGALIDYCELNAAKPPKRKHALGPLERIFAKPDILKVFHAPANDLHILYELMGKLPKSLVDTQAMYGAVRHHHMAGYADVVKNLLGVDLDKTQQRSSWSTRPLKQDQLEYASADVSHLFRLYPLLTAELDLLGRRQFINEYFREKLTVEASIRESRKNVGRLKDMANREADKENAPQLDRLVALAHWRKRQFPKYGGRVFKDLANLDLLALSKGDDVLQIKRYRPYRAKLKKLLASHPLTPEGPMEETTCLTDLTPLVSRMMDVLKNRAKELSMAPQLLATKSTFIEALRDRSPSLYEGERAKLIGWSIPFLLQKNVEYSTVALNWAKVTKDIQDNATEA